MAYIEFDRVCKLYPPATRALDNMSFTVEKGELCVIVGHSGAGKTTLLNILGGMDTATSGHVRLDGREITGLGGRALTEYRRNDVGFVFQFYNLVQNLTARENVELAAEICRGSLPAEEVLTKLGLADRMDNFPAQLSGGEQQRVSIARAILKNPAILILDEATAAMDTQTERAIQESLNALTKNRTTIMIAHRLSTLRDADKLIVIENVKMPEAGTAEELLKKKGVYYKLYKMQAEALKTIGIEE